MYICLCHIVTSQDVEDHVQQNDQLSPNEICRKLGIGKSCGVCKEDACGIIKTIKDKKSSNKSS